MSANLDVGVIIQLDEFKRKLAELPKETAAAQRELSRQFASNLRQQEQQTKAAQAAAVKAAQEAARAEAAQISAQEHALDELIAVRKKAEQAVLSGIDAINAKYDEQIKRINDVADVADNDAVAAKARAAVRAQQAKEVADFEAQEAQRVAASKAAAATQLEGIEKRLVRSTLEGVDAINAKYEDELAQIRKLAAATGDQAAAVRAEAAVEKARAAEVKRFEEGADRTAKGWIDAGKKIASTLGEGTIPRFEKLSGIVDALGAVSGASAAKIVLLTGVFAVVAFGAIKLAGSVNDAIRNVDALSSSLTAQQRVVLGPQIEALHRARDAYEGLDQAGTKAKLTLAAVFAPLAEQAANATAFVLDRASTGLAALTTGTNPLDVAAQQRADFVGPQAPGTADLYQKQQQLILAQKTEAEAKQKATEAAQRAEQAAAREDARKKAAAERAKAATEQLAELTQEAQDAQLQGEDKIYAAAERRFDQIAKLEAASNDAAAAAKARAASEMQLIDELAKYRIEKASEANRKALELAAAEADAQKLAAQKVQAVVDQRTQQIGAITSTSLAGLASLTSSIGDLVGQVYENQANAAERGSRAEREARLKAFKAAKATAIATAAINVATGVTQALSGPFPLNYINAALVTALGAVQIGLIAARQPPPMHIGGMVTASGYAPDEVPIRAQVGEAVLSRVGVQAVGGPDAVASANRGQSAGAGGGIVVVNQYEHRVFGAFAYRELQRPRGALAVALRKGKLAGLRSVKRAIAA